MPKGDLSLLKAVLTRQQLNKAVVGIVDDQRGRSCKVSVRPGVAEHVHRDPGSLEALAPCKRYGVLYKLAVWVADQPVFCFVPL